jgi:hypothetical protein
MVAKREMMGPNPVGAIRVDPERINIGNRASITSPAQILFEPACGRLFGAKKNNIGAELACRFPRDLLEKE